MSEWVYFSIGQLYIVVGLYDVICSNFYTSYKISARVYEDYHDMVFSVDFHGFLFHNPEIFVSESVARVCEEE